jgi:hypothetical protein
VITVGKGPGPEGKLRTALSGVWSLERIVNSVTVLSGPAFATDAETIVARTIPIRAFIFVLRK